MEGINISSSTPLLPPGFRFHPTDEELISYYLKTKVSSPTSPSVAIIADIDLYKFNPWDLPDKALFGEDEWFFFSPRDRKYPNGVRPNRAAVSGYWKATGTDKPILSSCGSQCVGVKKALVFYGGRPPKGLKTDWMMYEYRLRDDNSQSMRIRGSMRLDDWVLCRVRQKGSLPISRADNPEESNGCKSFPPRLGIGRSFEEKDIAEKMDYLKESDQLIISTQVVDELGKVFGGSSSSSSSDILLLNTDYEVQSVVPPVVSMKAALDKIKRVLSIGGAMDELVQMPPSKRPMLNHPRVNIFHVSSNS